MTDIPPEVVAQVPALYVALVAIIVLVGMFAGVSLKVLKHIEHRDKVLDGLQQSCHAETDRQHATLVRVIQESNEVIRNNSITLGKVLAYLKGE